MKVGSLSCSTAHGRIPDLDVFVGSTCPAHGEHRISCTFVHSHGCLGELDYAGPRCIVTRERYLQAGRTWGKEHSSGAVRETNSEHFVPLIDRVIQQWNC